VGCQLGLPGAQDLIQPIAGEIGSERVHLLRGDAVAEATLRAPQQMHAFTTDFSSYRLDEVLGAWKPYYDVVSNAAPAMSNRISVP
jgi:hypothetical protein